MERATQLGIAAAACGAAVGYLAATSAHHQRQSTEKEEEADKDKDATAKGALAPASAAPAAPAPDSKELVEKTDAIIATLKKYNPVQIEGMDPALHYLAPHIPRTVWADLGNLIVAREKAPMFSVPGDKWFSLRLDGSNFSKVTKKLRQRGILEPGFSPRMATAMQACLKGLMVKFNAKIGYTQSDEMCILIPPASVVRGEQQVHIRSGRAVKICTIAAGYVTAQFMAEVGKLSGLHDEVGEILPHFDCRIAAWDSWEEAKSLLLWRAYDCTVNGVSDAVHQIKGAGKGVMQRGKREKVEWLWKNGSLPLPSHQAYGSTIVKVKRVVEGKNPKTGTVHKTHRGVLESRSVCVIELFRQNVLFLEDDPLPSE